MAEHDYKPNSNKSKAEERERRVSKVISGTATTVKKKKSSKIAESFIGEDAGNIGSYILNDVLIPSIKKAVVDIVTDGIAMLLGTEKKSKRGDRISGSYVSYRSYSDDRDRDNYRRSRNGYDFDNIKFESRGEAEEVLERMDELIDQYRLCSVADLYDLAGLSCEYTDNKYGWTSLRSASVVRVSDGYIIKLPRANVL